jgi:hypothetical protein
MDNFGIDDDLMNRDRMVSDRNANEIKKVGGMRRG